VLIHEQRCSLHLVSRLARFDASQQRFQFAQYPDA
jgi:hypothetical protein